MTVRKDAFALTQKEQNTYKESVEDLIQDGTYSKLVAIHTDMSHRMHDMGEPNRVGIWRFLSWHRAYVLRFEELLVKKNSTAFVPYLNWVQGGVPDWLDDFRPTVDGTRVERNKLRAAISNRERINLLLSFPDYFSFTYELERNPHNKGHVDIGPTMSIVRTAPSDPIFWMHHGQVDRIWAIWQDKNPGKGPILSGLDAQMDPWKENVGNLSSIKSLGYSYAETAV